MSAQDSKLILSLVEMLILMGFHAVVFVTSLSLCLGFATLISMVYELYFGYKTGIAIVSMIAILPMKMVAAEILQFQVKSKCGLWLDKRKKASPIALVKVPAFLYSGLFVVAFCQMYYQYENLHSVSSGLPNASVTLDTSDIVTRKKRFWDFEFAPVVFSVSVFYMVYMMARENDWARYCRQLSETVRNNLQERSGFCITISTWFFYFITQIVLLMVYGVPLLLILGICTSLEISTCITFLTVTTAAFLIGVAAVELESAEPFPDIPLKAPRYHLESHLSSRATLAFVMCIPVVGFFFRYPKNTPGPGLVNNAEEYFLTYLMVVSLTIIQGTKIMINTVQQHRQIQETQQQEKTQGTSTTAAVTIREGDDTNLQFIPGPTNIDIASS